MELGSTYPKCPRQGFGVILAYGSIKGLKPGMPVIPSEGGNTFRKFPQRGGGSRARFWPQGGLIARFPAPEIKARNFKAPF